MSFILDALRKSEHERQRQNGPSIAELPVARAERAPRWAPLAIALLVALNVGVVAFFLLRGQTAGTTQAVLAVPAVAPDTVTAPPAEQASAMTPASPPPQAAPAAIPPAVQPLASIAEMPVTQAPPPAPDPTLLPAAPRPAFSPPQEQLVPSIHELSPQVTAGLPAYSVDLHIYANDPAKRAVFINGRRYQEGEALPEGPMVVSITRDGAVVSYRGRRFLLPRQ